MTDTDDSLRRLCARLTSELSKLREERDALKARAVEMTKEIIELHSEDRKGLPFLSTLFGVPIERFVRFLDAITENASEAGQEVLEVLTAEKARAEAADAKLNETWTDEEGTVWRGPTAWAYGRACKALSEAKAELEKARKESAVRLEVAEHLSAALKKADAALSTANETIARMREALEKIAKWKGALGNTCGDIAAAALDSLPAEKPKEEKYLDRDSIAKKCEHGFYHIDSSHQCPAPEPKPAEDQP